MFSGSDWRWQPAAFNDLSCEAGPRGGKLFRPLSKKREFETTNTEAREDQNKVSGRLWGSRWDPEGGLGGLKPGGTDIHACLRWKPYKHVSGWTERRMDGWTNIPRSLQRSGPDNGERERRWEEKRCNESVLCEDLIRRKLFGGERNLQNTY